MPTLDFKGKQFVYAHHLSVPFRTLDIDAKKSLPRAGKKPDLDDNLIIHGDNLHALKALLPTYAGKVDCVFIDPPYNTGNEGWCYNDNVRSPLMKEWLKNSANPVDKEDLERHEKWCCMMWPRLKMLHELLSDQGVLFVTIDDNEQHRLRLLLDDVFGAERFYAHIVWQKRYSSSNDYQGICAMHDHVLVYRKSDDFERNLLERTEEKNAQYRLNDKQGTFRPDNYTCNKTAEERPNLFYPIVNPNTGDEIWPSKTAVWRYTRERHQLNVDNDLVYWGKDGTGKVPAFKRYKHRLKGGGATVPVTWWPYAFAGHTDQAKKELLRIGEWTVDLTTITPKPVQLVEKILDVATDENSIILDSFAGSATTAHAVLKQNQKDGGNRKFILVECEDYADKLTAERVRRVISGYDFEGTQKEELYRRKLNFTALKKANEILESVEGIETLEGHRFDKISKTVKNDELIVTGEKKVTQKTEGLGGSFTYCTLGEEINLQTLLSGDKLPEYDALAKYVFYTATGQTLPKIAKPSKTSLIGETSLYRVHMIYKPDKKWLRSNSSALTQDLADTIAKQADPTKKTLVFASTKFMSQKDLTRQHIEFCQLPYAIYRVLGD